MSRRSLAQMTARLLVTRPMILNDMALSSASESQVAWFDSEIALFRQGTPFVEGASSRVAALAESLG